MEHMEDQFRQLIESTGERPDRDGLKATPGRAARAFQYLTKGYGETAEEAVSGAIFESDMDEMIIVRNIEIYSLCEHHMLPFYGNCHVGYIPKGKVLGLSKVARIAEVYARRLQLQYVELWRMHLPTDSSPEQVEQIKRSLLSAGLEPIAYGVVYFTADHEQNESLFKIGKAMGLSSLTASPTVRTRPCIHISYPSSRVSAVFRCPVASQHPCVLGTNQRWGRNSGCPSDARPSRRNSRLVPSNHSTGNGSSCHSGAATSARNAITKETRSTTPNTPGLHRLGRRGGDCMRGV